MKKQSVKLYAARAGSGAAYIYNEKLIPQGDRGVHTASGEFPPSGEMVNAKGLFELMGISFPRGATFELEITITEPRREGWYPVMISGEKRIFHWDGKDWHNGIGSGAKWHDSEFSWVADEPISDPFEGMS